MRKRVYLLFPLLLCGLWFVFPSFSQPVVVRYVSNTSLTCNGQAFCYPTIQAAVSAAQAGDTIRIQAGQYNEAVIVKGKNKTPGATEADRLFIEADPATPIGSVIIGASRPNCTAGTVFQFASSRFVTLRGVTNQ